MKIEQLLEVNKNIKLSKALEIKELFDMIEEKYSSTIDISIINEVDTNISMDFCINNIYECSFGYYTDGTFSYSDYLAEDIDKEIFLIDWKDTKNIKIAQEKIIELLEKY